MVKLTRWCCERKEASGKKHNSSRSVNANYQQLEAGLRSSGGSLETQKEFLDILDSESPKKPQERNRRKPPVANEFALGYTYQDVLDADHEGTEGC